MNADLSPKTDFDGRLVRVTGRNGVVIFRACELVCAMPWSDGWTRIYFRSGPLVDVKESADALLEKLCGT